MAEYTPERRKLLFVSVSLKTNFSIESCTCLVVRRMFRLCVRMLGASVQWEVNIFLEAVLPPGQPAVTYLYTEGTGNLLYTSHQTNLNISLLNFS